MYLFEDFLIGRVVKDRKNFFVHQSRTPIVGVHDLRIAYDEVERVKPTHKSSTRTL